MISYGTPLCAITHQTAKHFCVTENCDKPAFACQSEELDSHQHGISTRCHFWDAAFPAIQQVVERGLQPSDVAALEKQEKQLQMLIEDLKALQDSHRKNIHLCRQRQQLKATADKVIAAVRDGNTDAVTGNDMAVLVKAIQNNDAYENASAVDEAILERNKMVDGLLAKLSTLIEEHNKRETGLPRP